MPPRNLPASGSHGGRTKASNRALLPFDPPVSISDFRLSRENTIGQFSDSRQPRPRHSSNEILVTSSPTRAIEQILLKTIIFFRELTRNKDTDLEEYLEVGLLEDERRSQWYLGRFLSELEINLTIRLTEIVLNSLVPICSLLALFFHFQHRVNLFLSLKAPTVTTIFPLVPRYRITEGLNCQHLICCVHILFVSNEFSLFF